MPWKPQSTLSELFMVHCLVTCGGGGDGGVKLSKMKVDVEHAGDPLGLSSLDFDFHTNTKSGLALYC